MNCEMAQRTIALAALAPSPGRHLRADAHLSAPAGECLPDRTDSMVAEERLLSLFEAEASHPPGSAELDGISELPEDVPEDERRALEEHLAHCRECQAEMAASAAFYRALSLTRQPEPTPNLVARARLRLDATLDSNAHQSVVAHLLQQISFSAGRLRAAPGLASGLLLFGLFAGGYGGYRVGHAAHNEEQRGILLSDHQVVAAVTGIVREPDSERVEVHYDRLVPDTVSGTLDDPSIRQLLMIGTEEGTDPLVRNSSFDLISSECRHGHGCNGGAIRTALLTALNTDRDPQVRIMALHGLEPYIAEDMQVRDAVVRAVMTDADSAVRIEAIRLLTPVEVDSSVRHALHTVAVEDDDPSIRNESQKMLSGMPQVQ